MNAGQPASFSWHELVEGHAATPDDCFASCKSSRRSTIRSSSPASRPTDAIRQAAADLDFACKYQARLRLTGPVPMADEEFATIKENAGAQRHGDDRGRAVHSVAGAALGAHHFAVFVCLVVGLSITAALGMLMVGTLNLISVYFAVLFVGLGVDFGLQFSVRYRAERHEVDDLREALLQAGRRAGAPLTLAALATAAGFLSFLPTVYKGVSELGLIAGVGMLIAFATSITLLPALLSVLKPPSEPAPARLCRAGAGRQLSRPASHADPDRHRPSSSRADCRCFTGCGSISIRSICAAPRPRRSRPISSSRTIRKAAPTTSRCWSRRWPRPIRWPRSCARCRRLRA